MEEQLIETMKRIREQRIAQLKKGNTQVTGTYYYGKVAIEGIQQDVFVIIEKDLDKPDSEKFRFVNSENELIAICINDEQFFYPSERYAEEMSKDENGMKEEMITFAAKVRQKEEQEKVKSKADLDNKKEKDGDDKEKKSSITEEKKDTKKKEGHIKQRIPINQRINQEQTLREVTNAPENAVELQVVDTDSLDNSELKNGNRFSLVFKCIDKNGNEYPEPVSSAKLVGGNNPNNKIATADRSNDEADFMKTNAVFEFPQENGDSYIMSLGKQDNETEPRIGRKPQSQGLDYAEVYGSMVPLETANRRATTLENRVQVLGAGKGRDIGNRQEKEAGKHVDCEKDGDRHKHSVGDIDGNKDTGIEGKIEKLWEQEGDTLGEFCNKEDLKRHFEENPQIIEGIDINDSQQRKAIVIYLESEFGLSKGPAGRRR